MVVYQDAVIIQVSDSVSSAIWTYHRKVVDDKVYPISKACTLLGLSFLSPTRPPMGFDFPPGPAIHTKHHVDPACLFFNILNRTLPPPLQVPRSHHRYQCYAAVLPPIHHRPHNTQTIGSRWKLASGRSARQVFSPVRLNHPTANVY